MLKKIQSANRDLNLVQDNVDSALRDIERVDFLTAKDIGTANPDFARRVGSLPFLGGVVIEQVYVAAGKDNLIPHALGRVPSYWVILRKKSQGDLWEAATSKLMDANGANQSVNSRYINLKSSADVLITLWVA